MPEVIINNSFLTEQALKSYQQAGLFCATDAAVSNTGGIRFFVIP
jgi:hypothetical protein